MPIARVGGEERRRALRVVPGADDVADQVQHQEARALHHLGRQPVEADVGGELRKFGGDAHGDFLPVRTSFPQRDEFV